MNKRSFVAKVFDAMTSKRKVAMTYDLGTTLGYVTHYLHKFFEYTKQDQRFASMPATAKSTLEDLQRTALQLEVDLTALVAQIAPRMRVQVASDERTDNHDA